MAKYVTLDFQTRKNLEITMMEYALAERIYFLAFNKGNKFPGWCWASKPTLADDVGYSRKGIFNAIKNLESKGYIERNEQGWITPTIKYHNIARDTGSVESTHIGYKVPTGSVESTQPDSVESTPNNKSIINKEVNIKLHSLKFSEENIQGDSEDVFSEEGQEEIPVEPKKKANPFKLSDDEIRFVDSYYKGFIEEIDKVAQVEYSKDIRYLYKTFKLLKRNRTLFCDVYIYFKTYRDITETYITEIRSLNSLSQKIDKLQAEMIRETKRVIKEKGSIVLHQDNIKKIAVVYNQGKIKQADKTRIELMPKTGYKVYDISRSIGTLEFSELGYVERNTFA